MSLIDIRDIERSFMQKSSFEPLHLEKTLYSINFTIALYQIAKHMSINMLYNYLKANSNSVKLFISQACKQALETAALSASLYDKPQ